MPWVWSNLNLILPPWDTNCKYLSYYSLTQNITSKWLMTNRVIEIKGFVDSSNVKFWINNKNKTDDSPSWPVRPWHPRLWPVGTRTSEGWRPRPRRSWCPGAARGRLAAAGAAARSPRRTSHGTARLEQIQKHLFHILPNNKEYQHRRIFLCTTVLNKLWVTQPSIERNLKTAPLTSTHLLSVSC